MQSVATQVALLMQRKLVEENLRISEAKLAEAQRFAHVGNWEFNVTTGKITWSDEKYRIFGFNPTEAALNYAQIVERFHPDDRVRFQQAVEQLLRIGTPYHADFRIVRPNGEVRYINSIGKADINEQGQVNKLFGTVIDITERILVQQDLEQTLVQLKRTQTQLVQSEKMSSLGQIVAGIAHEINNPVSFIYGNINPAKEYATNLLNLIYLYQRYYPKSISEIAAKLEEVEPEFIAEDFPKLLDSMKEGAERINQIVLSLRNFARLDECDRKRVDIHPGIDNTLVIFQYRLNKQPHREPIQVVKDYGELPTILCYPGQLNQVFLNILSNAIDAINEVDWSMSGDEPTIWIWTEVIENYQAQKDETKDKKQWIKICIANNGSCINPDILPKIFDPFFTTKPVGSARGIGLSICYQIVVERHGGRLTCDSKSNRRTEFVIELPILDVTI